MLKTCPILVVGNCTIVSRRFSKVRGYEEAIEMLNQTHFNIVITDAKLPETYSGHDVLDHVNKCSEVKPTVIVCHPQSSHIFPNGTCWWIERSLVCFPFARFYLGTIDGWIRTNDEALKKCA